MTNKHNAFYCIDNNMQQVISCIILLIKDNAEEVVAVKSTCY